MKSILLVDDDEALCEALSDALDTEGHRVECCKHGADALAKLRAGRRPDLILLDLMMPVMDGWAFREAQLAHADLAAIPVIVITAAGTLNQPIDAQRLLTKPFQLHELFRAINDL